MGHCAARRVTAGASLHIEKIRLPATKERSPTTLSAEAYNTDRHPCNPMLTGVSPPVNAVKDLAKIH